MRRLYPAEADHVELEEAYAVPRTPGVHVRANFVTSVDGAAEIRGTSAGLSSPEDKQIFRVLRTLSDVVLVGAETVRREGYGPARLAPDSVRWRARRGMDPLLPIAVVSGRLDIDFESSFFAEAAARPILITTARAPGRQVERAQEVAEVIQAGEERVDMGAAIDALASRGLRQVLAEGGPSLFAQLVALGRLDELCLTVSPVLGGPELKRIVAGAPFEPRRLELLHVLSAADALFLRYRATLSPTTS